MSAYKSYIPDSSPLVQMSAVTKRPDKAKQDKGTITIEEARQRARLLPHYRKCLKLTVFITQRLGPAFRATCGGVEKACINKCSIVSLPKLSFISSCSTTKRKPTNLKVSNCEINYGLSGLKLRTDAELIKLIEVAIDLEVMDHMICISTQPVVVHVLRRAQQTLVDAIQRTWSTLRDANSKTFCCNLSSLSVKGIASNISDFSVAVSIKMALCNFISQMHSRFHNQEAFTQQQQLSRLVKYFLVYLNNYVMPLPSEMQFASQDHYKLYHSYYVRWMANCIIPDTCKSFVKYQVINFFGQHYLQMIFPHFSKATLDRLKFEQNSTSPQDQFSLGESFIKFLLFPEFILFLEREFIFSSNAPQFWSTSLAEETKISMNDRIFGFEEDIELMHTNFGITQVEDAQLQLIERVTTDSQRANTDMIEPFYHTNLHDQLILAKFPSQSYNVSATPEQVILLAEKFLLKASEEETEQLQTYLSGKDIKEMDPFTMELKQICQQLRLDRGVTHQKANHCCKDISFQVVQNRLQQDENDADIHELFWLLDLLEVINVALPQMGKSYIARLIFDPRQQAMLLLKSNNNITLAEDKFTRILNAHQGRNVIGGISFRPFAQQGFSEVAFVTILPSEQVKGYGTRMMNAVKDYHCKTGILYLLTYADCEAVEFFAKQGFSSDIRLDKTVYHGYIKEYQGAILMECQLNPLICYADLSQRVRLQKDILLKLVEGQQQQSSETVTLKPDSSPSIIPLSDILQLASKNNIDASLVDFEDHSIELTPKLRDIVFELCASPVITQAPSLLSQLYLTEEEDYTQLIAYPMDLNMVLTRVNTGYYKNIRLFHADVMRVFHNHRTYFGHHGASPVMMKVADQLLHLYTTRMETLGMMQTLL